MTQEQYPADHATLFYNTPESKKKDITWKVAYQMNPIRRRVRLDSPPTAPLLSQVYHTACLTPA